jgi:hypothetical protein
LLLVPDRQRPEEVDREDDPDHGDRDVDPPLELGVFLRLRDPERQRDRRAEDDELPTPEVDAGQQVADAMRVLQSRCVE